MTPLLLALENGVRMALLATIAPVFLASTPAASTIAATAHMIDFVSAPEGVGDPCPVTVEAPAPRLHYSAGRLGLRDNRLLLLGAAPLEQRIDPVATGLELRMSTVDAWVAPAGLFRRRARYGWTVSELGRRWIYRDRRDRTGRLTRFRHILVAISLDGSRVAFRLVAQGGYLVLGRGDLPLEFTVVLAPGTVPGACVLTSIGDCTVSRHGHVLRCP